MSMGWRGQFVNLDTGLTKDLGAEFCGSSSNSSLRVTGQAWAQRDSCRFVQRRGHDPVRQAREIVQLHGDRP